MRMLMIGLLFLAGVLIITFYLQWINNKVVLQPSPTATITPFPSIITISKEETTSIFVPYWALGNTKDTFVEDYVYYFGITANKNGIDKSEVGYLSLKNFTTSNITGKKYLTIRLLNFEINSLLLKDKTFQDKIIDESIESAKKYDFNGIVLDFEMHGLSFDSLINSISSLYNNFYHKIKQNNLSFFTTIYGDVYFKLRPYDVSQIEKNSDKIIIMAYDFHKALGDPGPNFPLKGKEKYGYDYHEMIKNFTEHVPTEKVEVIFGMYGYEWKLDKQQKTIRRENSYSLYKIKQDFLDSCIYDNCMVTRDAESSETKVTYTRNNENYVLWLEDESSVERKKLFLKSKGIEAFGYWAYSYY